MSLSPFSTAYEASLWEQHPRYIEHAKMKQEMEQSGYNSEQCRAYEAWNPIPESSTRNLVELQKRIHPAVILEEKLIRIEDKALDIFRTSFLWRPKFAEEITDANFVGRTITYHTNDYPLSFKPSNEIVNIAKVLLQLPVGRAITHHTNGYPLSLSFGYPLSFKPSIAEVLLQLPEGLINGFSKECDLYFTTEPIHSDPSICAIGSWSRYHVAITTAYVRQLPLD